MNWTQTTPIVDKLELLEQLTTIAASEVIRLPVRIKAEEKILLLLDDLMPEPQSIKAAEYSMDGE